MSGFNALKLEKVISSVFPKCKISKDIAYQIAQKAGPFNIKTDKQLASFIAQCGHESAGFTKFEENLNYSVDGIKRVFPKYFKTVDPNDYARNPEKLANRVYAFRMGNGDEDSGAITDLDWPQMLAVTATSMVLSALTSHHPSRSESQPWFYHPDYAR